MEAEVNNVPGTVLHHVKNRNGVSEATDSSSVVSFIGYSVENVVLI